MPISHEILCDVCLTKEYHYISNVSQQFNADNTMYRSGEYLLFMVQILTLFTEETKKHTASRFYNVFVVMTLQTFHMAL